MAISKQYNVKFYDADGTTIKKNWSPLDLKRPPTFTSRINGVYGECKIELAIPLDDFGEGTDVDFMHIAEIWVVVTDSVLLTQRDDLVYKGYLSSYEAYALESGHEGVICTLLGLGSLLNRGYYKSGSSYTVAHATKDPEFIGKAIIDHFNTIFGGALIGYSGTTETVGVNVSNDYVDQKWFTALKKTAELAGTDWWWSVDRNGDFNLKSKPSGATHTFTLGENVRSIRAKKTMEKVVNDVQVRHKTGTSDYSNSASQTKFGTGSTPSGKHTKILTEADLTAGASSDQRGNKEINDHKDEKINTKIEVKDPYNIESIHVGDTCRVRNFKAAQTFFSSNMLITKVAYRGDYVICTLDEHAADFGTVLDEFVNG